MDATPSLPLNPPAAHSPPPPTHPTTSINLPLPLTHPPPTPPPSPQSKVVKPAFVVVPSAADRFPSYGVDVAATQAMQVRACSAVSAFTVYSLLG